MNEVKFRELDLYLKMLTDTFKISICIKDFIGFTNYDNELKHIIVRYQDHRNVFCMKIKYGYKLWRDCNNNVISLSQRCDKERAPFYGYCKMGIGEYIVPIMRKGIAIGALCCGPICKDQKISTFLIGKRAKPKGFDSLEALALYNQVQLEKDIGIEKVESILGIAAAYLGEIVSNLSVEQIMDEKKSYLYKVSKQKSIIFNIVEYINQNYAEDINVKKMAELSLCSESYINHEFKACMGMNLKAYLNTVRVSAASKLLVESQDTITYISSAVGFNDPDYFTSVFKKLYNITPSELRANPAAINVNRH